ncbi:MAG: TIGR00266 family protein [Firmicutes bacterium]|nr:TIGR00266 family protein [Bacillota bacterium]
MNYTIECGTFPVAIVNLEEGESLHTDGGAMAWMSPNLEMETEGGGSFGRALGRMFSGEKIFRNVYTAVGGPGYIALNPKVPGEILAVEITPDKPIILQKSSFLASTMGVSTEVFFNKKASTGLFAGEGFVMQKIFGEGTVFIEIDGATKEYYLESGETMIVDTGSLAMMDATCSMDIRTIKGVKNVLFGGEGLFNTVISGPGKVTVQTLSLKDLASALIPYLPTQSSSSSD